VASARDVEDLTRSCGNVVRSVVPLKKHHAVFAERDEDVVCFPFLQERFASSFKLKIFRWSFIGITPGNARSEECFRPVWFHNTHTAPVNRMSRIGIGRHYLTSHARLACNLGN